MPFKKGQSGNPAGKPIGIKNAVTLLKEERRAIFEEHISNKFIETIDKARPEYILDQFLGKAPEEHKIRLEADITHHLPEEKIQAINNLALDEPNE